MPLYQIFLITYAINWRLGERFLYLLLINSTFLIEAYTLGQRGRTTKKEQGKEGLVPKRGTVLPNEGQLGAMGQHDSPGTRVSSPMAVPIHLQVQ